LFTNTARWDRPRAVAVVNSAARTVPANFKEKAARRAATDLLAGEIVNGDVVIAIVKIGPMQRPEMAIRTAANTVRRPKKPRMNLLDLSLAPGPT
jgi:hypothetical protein